MKYLFASVIIAGLLCVACSHRNDVVVASVYDETLTMSDLQDMIPDFDPSSDSLSVQSYYIDKWIQKQALA